MVGGTVHWSGIREGGECSFHAGLIEVLPEWAVG